MYYNYVIRPASSAELHMGLSALSTKVWTEFRLGLSLVTLLTSTSFDQTGGLTRSIDLAVSAMVEFLITHGFDKIILQPLFLTKKCVIVDVTQVYTRVYLDPGKVDIL